MIEKLKKLYGKRVRVVTNDNYVIVGKFSVYQRPGDNEYECDTICIEDEPNSLIEIKVNEIKEIELSTQ